MAFAKLSASLLVRNEPVVLAPTVARVPSAPAVQPMLPMANARQLTRDLKALRLPAFLGHYDALAKECAAEGVDHAGYLLRLVEREMDERHQRRVERLIKEARFPAGKSLADFSFSELPALDERLVRELARCDYIANHENVIAVGGSGTGKTHIAVALGLAACQKGFSVGFYTAASLVHELLDARTDRLISKLLRRLGNYSLLIIDDLGYVPLPADGAELLFEVFGQRCEGASTIITGHQSLDNWVSVFGSEHLARAALDRLGHRAHFLDMSGESYRPKQGKPR
jgi:DNA replication protein DnaC